MPAALTMFATLKDVSRHEFAGRSEILVMTGDALFWDEHLNFTKLYFPRLWTTYRPILSILFFYRDIPLVYSEIIRLLF